MDLRLCFENKSGVSIDDTGAFKHYAGNYLSGFDIRWAGSVSVTHSDKKTTNMEPLWQLRIENASPACRDYLCEYLTRNPMCGYFVHVYESHRGQQDTKIF